MISACICVWAFRESRRGGELQIHQFIEDTERSTIVERIFRESKSTRQSSNHLVKTKSERYEIELEEIKENVYYSYPKLSSYITANHLRTDLRPSSFPLSRTLQSEVQTFVRLFNIIATLNLQIRKKP